VTPSRGPRVCLIVIFLVLIGIVAPSQIVLDLRNGETSGIVDLFRQTPTRASLRRLESDLESKCRLAQAVRPLVQYARFVLLQDAGDQALLGRDGWFFYRPAVQYLVEPVRSVPVRAYPETPHGVTTNYYLAQDSHWSPEGLRKAAEVVARRLLDSGWVEKGSVKYETKPISIKRYGDVLRMIRVPQVERLYEPEQINCTQVVNTKTGKPYVDDPNSPVLVLGDSFLRIFERDEPGSGGFIAHLAHNLGFGLTSIVNDGGASTLVRQQLARKPALLKGKKVVVWEFVERDIRFGTEGWQVIPLP